MSNETARLQMSLLMPAQAQKHVTVNEALMRLDGLVNLVLESVSTAVPPGTVLDGQCWGVPQGATGDWSGQDEAIAIGSNGGWLFVPPRAGMRAFVRDCGADAVHDGAGWAVGALTMGQGGSGLIAGIAEGEVTLTAGATVITGIVIPGGAMVIGATARVKDAITGTLTSWRLGTMDGTDRFGRGLGTAQDSWARGMLGTPMTYWQPEPLILTADGGEFAGGRVALAVHWLEMRLPS
ncbi:DUF2793 domain-containing protein [Paracoccus sp. 1_MG-2023]|uniref:DUF2793 domain-containing protein n=1 Tax=unclassified Paracoccus (in: a-proteobacteria) TaxID=2688777 RepID=UPI001C08C4FA|nr:MULTISPECIES: DUF2793 domain-containing protein [unclassified Paracoccus (in: a-proteobacteria)]MBU2958641.1 DUF2793 domain-containing protein [Paracoccus sp. C2R09]MDO6667634.1 DUF2793 domain-containing protein [Paracoccus sp. 1_MG-2023]